MRNATILTLALLLAGNSVMAAERTISEMRSIAAAKLTRTATVKGQRTTKVQPASLQCVKESQTYAVFTPAEGQEGFVIVAKSDLVEPVIGYSTEQFDANNMPDGLQWYLRTVSRNLAAVETGAIQAPRLTSATYTPVENFVTTKWDQAYPYDRKTPNNFPSGCGATAIAQCMNYCQYPPSAEFDAVYYVTTVVGKKENTERKTEHVSTTYTWPYKDTYKSYGKYGDNIDELMRDCGYAMVMNYSKNGSGTSGFMPAMAFANYFSYPEESIKYYSRDYFTGTNDEWNQIIYDELALLCPIVYGGSDPTFGGHAFVFSGVDADGLVYVNWGWSGAANGFYVIELMNPYVSGEQNQFSENQHMCVGIRKDPLPTDAIRSRIWGYSGDPYTFRFGTEKDDNEVEHVTLYADLPYGFLNLCPSGFQGVFGLFAQDLTDGSSWVIAEDLQDRDTIPSGYGYCGSSQQYKDFYFYYFVDGEKGLKPGHSYRISFGTKDDREGEWHSILCVGGELAYDITYTGDPETSTVDPEIKSTPILSAIHAPLLPAAQPTNKLSGWFDLSGRRTAEPRRGLYLHNGRKVVK